MQIYQHSKPIIKSFNFGLRPEVFTIRINAKFKNFDDFRWNRIHQKVSLPKITIEVGEKNVVCRFRLCCDDQNYLVPKLDYKSDDIRHEMCTIFIVFHENNSKTYHKDRMPLIKGIDVVEVSCDATFVRVVSKLFETIEFCPKFPDVLLRARDGIVPYNVHMATVLPPVFKDIIEKTPGNKVLIDIPEFDISTVEIALTLLRGDTPYQMTSFQRERVSSFADKYQVAHIKNLFPALVEDNEGF